MNWGLLWTLTVLFPLSHLLIVIYPRRTFPLKPWLLGFLKSLGEEHGWKLSGNRIYLSTKPSPSLWLLSSFKESDSAWGRFLFTKTKHLGSSKVFVCLIIIFLIGSTTCSVVEVVVVLSRIMALLRVVWLWQCDYIFLILLCILCGVSQKCHSVMCL